MKIVVCIKQVPDVDNIKWTKENNLDRTNMLSKINPYDVYALDWALEIKKSVENCTITAISMGPNQASDVLNFALAKGADDAILLSDRAFSGSDTLITSKILSCAIRKNVPDFDLIITGQLAPDGDTMQVPVSLSTMLNVVDNTNIVEVKKVVQNEIELVQKFGNNFNVITAKIPTLIAVSGFNKESYTPKIDDYIRAQNTKIKVQNCDDLSLDKKEIGVLGSPTMVYRAFRPDFLKDAIEIKENFKESILKFLDEVKNGQD